MKAKMLTDSACDIPMELQKKYGVDIMNFDMVIDGVSYTERVDFTFEEYYEKLKTCEGIPSTSHITSLRFMEQYLAYDEEGYTDIIYVSINGAGSATKNAAIMGIEQFREERPASRMRIHVVDSHTYSMVYGWYVCKGAEKLANGASAEAVVSYLNDVYSRVEILLSVYTLKFIKKSGRVSAAAAFAGELLGLRPVISMIDDTTATVAKVRGDDAVAPALIKQAKQRMAEGSDYMVLGTAMENMKLFAKMCKKEFGKAPVGIFHLGAAVATNTGPHALAIHYFGEKRTR